MRIILILFSFFLLLYVLGSCGQPATPAADAISSDTAVIAAGKKTFQDNCSSCHEFKQGAIGPDLSGVTREVPTAWLFRFIKNPSLLMSSGDKRADSLFSKFKAIMPPFANLTDEDITAIIAFLNTKTHSSTPFKTEAKGITDPIPDKIRFTGLTVDLEPVMQFPPSAKEKLPSTRIVKLDVEPGTGNLFVNDQRGKLYKLKNGKPIVYMDLARLRPKFIDEPGMATGFGSFAFHPDFQKNGLLYTTHAEAPGSGKADFSFNDSIKAGLQWVLTEWKLPVPNADTLSASSRELFRIDMVSSAHGVQEITFNPLSKPGDPDFGLLYIGIGDGSSVQEGYPYLAHDKGKIWGSVIRIDPAGRNSANGKYGIPAGNPFVKEPGKKIVREIYAYGFRNPHRITWSRSGEMLVSVIGQANIEALDLVKAGQDFGWPIREGNFLFNPHGNLDAIFPLPANDSIYKITYPVAAFDHDEGNAITGGYEYTGSSIKELKGKFLFGDIPSGRLFYINMADIKTGKLATIHEWRCTVNGVQGTLKKACGNNRVDLRFGKDAANELYLMTKADGKLYKLKSAVIKNQDQ